MIDVWKHVKVIKPSVWFITGLIFMVSVPETQFVKLQYAYHDFWDNTVEAPTNETQKSNK